MSKKTIKNLFQAIEDGNIDLVKQIIGVDADALECEGVGKVMFSGKTPLIYALQCGQTNIALFLLENHANANAKMSDSWRWPTLHFAVRTAVSVDSKPEDLHVLERMLTFGADPNATDAFGNTALDRSLLDYKKDCDAWKVIQVLVDAGANQANVGGSKMTTRELVSTNPHAFSSKVRSIMGIG
ncbi:ankyrin repeat domain-containing protein [Pendulispora rubella]|uniref:Ankyrin repeat domain-containing protein n=1 Tax=Pendulispora rubella TaxID=2741070 RepID=A0ABZ2L6K7_9BACT